MGKAATDVRGLSSKEVLAVYTGSCMCSTQSQALEGLYLFTWCVLSLDVTMFWVLVPVTLKGKGAHR